MTGLAAVRIENPGGYGRRGRVSIDGQEVAGVRRVTMTMDVSAVNTVNLDVLATGGLDLTLSAAVAVQVTAFPGYDLVAEPLPDGATRWRTARPDKEPT